ncbi:hypothetical protein N0V83_001443 [Neocucurbitaria cava]|uniref:DUF7730 domain-containing protein n=1 Tax=Neocucurbitaria cava TaxID=798079 RepID=A0A9W9CQE3_9PLEO|nr:hypothetical protein N0V83_001443 [Neocucurbitaria cava]
MKAKLRGFLPGMRWVPHDIPSPTDSTTKKSKSRNPFSLRPSDPYHGELRPRKSTISLTSQPDPELDRRTHAQGQSSFFARLPIELRRMVYEYVMGEETVHLTLGTKKNIRVLRLRWAIRALPYLRRGGRLAYREDTANWERGWAIIAGMQGLRDLYVALVDPSPQPLWERNWLELEEQLMVSVKQVKRPGWFELVLPYASCGTEWDMEDCRVRLRKPEGEDVEDEDN